MLILCDIKGPTVLSKTHTCTCYNVRVGTALCTNAPLNCAEDERCGGKHLRFIVNQS